MHPSLFLGALLLGHAQAAVVHLVAPSSILDNASVILDRRLASFSIEFSFLPDFGGNKTHPNLLTKELMQRLVERTGVGPDVRPGGITVDSSVFSPNASAVQRIETPTGGIWKTIFGPAYFQSLDTWPLSSRIIWSVNLGNNTLSFAQAGIAAALKYIGSDRIFAFELGNEADHYSWGSSRPSTWSSSDYTAQFLNWTSALRQNLSLPAHDFVAGGFAEDPTSAAPMTTVSIINDGIESTNAVKVYAQHTYQYSTCDPKRNAIATLPNLVNHQNIMNYLNLWKPQIAAAKSVGKEFIIGEYSSISCSGKQNVSDTFGQAMWLADTLLYGASIDVKRMHMHQGATLVLQSSQQANSPGYSWYDLWYPLQSERYGAPRASPSFVAYLLVTEAVGSSGTSRIALINAPSYPQLAVYAVWDGTQPNQLPARLAILNLSPRNATTSPEETAKVQVTLDISDYIDTGANKSVSLKRMRSPGLNSKDSYAITWAGQSYATGKPSGQEIKEKVRNGKVTVPGSEGVLVFLR